MQLEREGEVHILMVTTRRGNCRFSHQIRKSVLELKRTCHAARGENQRART